MTPPLTGYPCGCALHACTKISSYRIVWYRMVSYGIVSCPVMSRRVMAYTHVYDVCRCKQMYADVSRCMQTDAGVCGYVQMHAGASHGTGAARTRPRDEP